MSNTSAAKTKAKPPHPKPIVDAAGVRRYLSRNPSFFQDHQYLLSTLSIPHPVRPAVSLIEHQVTLLRAQNAELEKQNANQISLARDNERLNDQMRELCLSLFSATDLNQRLGILHNHLLKDLAATSVCVRFFCPPKAIEKAGYSSNLHVDISTKPFKDLFANFLKKPTPLCGRLSKDQRAFLFAQDAEQIQSAVLIPLNAYQSKTSPIGLLAIGSDSKDRFRPDMGTTFLDHLGELVGQALGVCLKQNQS